jgi:phage recombination protein Bet
MSNETKETKETKELAVVYQIDGNEIKLTPSIVQQYIVGSESKITMQEFKFFTELCKVQKLNPFLKEAYCIKYGNDPATIVVGKDVFVKRAVNNPQYNGKETGIIVQTEDGEIKERNGCFFAPGETVIGGWARVYRKDREHPEYMSVSVDEVAGKKKDGNFNMNWANKRATMVEKVAKVRALREAFIDDLQGMYVEEEFEADKPEIVQEPIKGDVIEVQAEVVEAEVEQVNFDAL